ncbi:MAG: sigma-70 family RNA polymerase sigma factor [Pyrinomonadaceae bacterium]
MYQVEATANTLLMNPQRQLDSASAAVELSTEAVLVKSVLEGDREQFAQLYDLYARMVHGILLARVPRDEVDDLVQDIFFLAFKKLHTLRNGAAFGSWIAMIARNRAMDFHRGSRETTQLEEDAPGPETNETLAGQVLDMIRALPDAYRETLVLRLVEGMTGPEIAERTGMTAASVRVNLHRGMKLLREKLGFKEGL